MPAILDRIAKRLGYVRPTSARRPHLPARRAYDGDSTGNLFSSWGVTPYDQDTETRNNIVLRRNRSRDLLRNNEYARRFCQAASNNILGADGIQLQMRVRQATGKQDERANEIIETAWQDWARPRNCTVSGRHSWREIQGQVLSAIISDGDVGVFRHRDPDHPHGYALQIVEADWIDAEYNNPNPATGNEVRMGVEVDRFRRPVAYYVLDRHPGDNITRAGGPSIRRSRVLARDFLLPFRADRPEQTRGVPWLTCVADTLKMLDGYHEAEIVAARTAAAKMVLFERTGSDGYEGEKDDEGNFLMDAQAGVMEELPAGLKPHFWDPSHPTSAYPDFVKAILRQVASGLGISYNSLANDLEGVNFSSIRAGLLEEREVWKALQSWYVDSFVAVVFDDWIRQALLTGAIPLPAAKLEKFNRPHFQGRRWDWVDPKKDAEAEILLVENNLKSRRRVAQEKGYDIHELYAEIEADEQLAEAHGIKLKPAPPAPPAPTQVDTGDTEDE